MILILARQDDAHVPYVAARLRRRGAGYAHFDAADFPAKSQINVDFTPTGLVNRTLRYKNGDIDLAAVTAVWNRARSVPLPADDVKAEHSWWVSEVSTWWLAEVWGSLDCLWVPDRPRADREPFRRPPSDAGPSLGIPPASAGLSAYSKLNQLAVASGLGFRIPRTRITNRPEDFLEFYEACNGRLVTKTVLTTQMSRNGERSVPYTFTVRRQDAANYRAVRYAPTVLQEYVPKRLELRVTVVGSDIFAAAIESQTSRITRDDWRREPAGERCNEYYSPYHLPPEIAALCLQLLQRLGLCFGAIDLVVTPDDEYVFLEVNPNGQWSWIEDVTGLPIADAIADLLIRGTVVSAG